MFEKHTRTHTSEKFLLLERRTESKLAWDLFPEACHTVLSLLPAPLPARSPAPASLCALGPGLGVEQEPLGSTLLSRCVNVDRHEAEAHWHMKDRKTNEELWSRACIK